MTRQRRSYTAQERAEAVGLATTMGVTAAARQLGIGHTTVSAWMRSPSPALQAVIVESREAVADKLWQAVVAGTDAVLRGLQDPRARLSDKARALEVVAAQHALLVGDATSRTENQNLNLSVNVADELSEDEQRALVASLRREMELRDEGALTEAELAELRAYLEAKGGQTDAVG